MHTAFSLEFYRGKRVLVTGHTGFKGAWLCHILKGLGAEVVGYAKEPPTTPSLYEIAHVGEGMRSVLADVRDFDTLYATFCDFQPEILLHLAAQPIVREGYREPLTTFDTNVMGTVNVLECVRRTECVRSAVIVTTDKVYDNENGRILREDDRLGGADPYAASKSCAEWVTESYKRSFLAQRGIAVSTARAGNVIGGGDFAADRILPDLVRGVLRGEETVLRHPDAVRPYQHVLEPLFCYLMLAARQCKEKHLAGSYNIGPAACDCITTRVLAELFFAHIAGVRFRICPDNGMREAEMLRLDCSKLEKTFAWHPTWSAAQAVERTAAWTRAYMAGEDVTRVMDAQIEEFINA